MMGRREITNDVDLQLHAELRHLFGERPFFPCSVRHIHPPKYVTS